MRNQSDMDNEIKSKDVIRILKVEPGRAPLVKEMNNDLAGIQKEIEGYFQCVYLEDGCLLVCNEEGKINGMGLNRRVGYDIIAGPFFIVGDDRSGEFVSLSDSQIQKYSKQFEEIQMFTGKEPEAEPRIIFIGFDS